MLSISKLQCSICELRFVQTEHGSSREMAWQAEEIVVYKSIATSCLQIQNTRDSYEKASFVFASAGLLEGFCSPHPGTASCTVVGKLRCKTAGSLPCITSDVTDERLVLHSEFCNKHFCNICADTSLFHWGQAESRDCFQFCKLGQSLNMCL